MIWVWVLIAFLLDLMLQVLIPMGDWRPDILLVAILFLSLQRPLGEAYLFAFVFGLMRDIAFLDPLGMHAFLFLLIAMITARLGALLWSHYMISRFVIGLGMCIVLRFGEVMFWLSNLRYEVPMSLLQNYVLLGAFTTGALFALIPWRTSPIQLSKPSPQVLFGE